MAHGRFVAYQPTSLQVIDGRPTQANPGSIRADHLMAEVMAKIRARLPKLALFVDNVTTKLAAAHWGLYDEHRQPKPVIKTLEKLSAVQ